MQGSSDYLFSESGLQAVNEEKRNKLFSAERKIALVRFAVISLNIIVYLFFQDKTDTVEWLAGIIVVVAFLYAVLVIAFRPYEKYPVLLTSYFTSGSDAILITLWILSTGGYDSPFYVLWYISIVAIAFRYNAKITITISILYSVLYCIILLFDPASYEHIADLIVRISYIILIGILSGFLTGETLQQIQAKLRIKLSEAIIKKREAELREINDHLEERVKERTLELNDINAELRRINEDLDNFVYAASHDLKSPIVNTEALLELLFDEDPKSEEEILELRSKITFSLNKIKNTINNLAEVAKAQKTVYEDIENLDFHEIIQEVICDTEELIKRTGTVIKLDLHARKIRASRTMTKSILYNLISNAIKYRSPERNPEIYISTENSEEYTLLNIKDNGLGIDLNKNRHKLFTIFKRFHDHVEGTGIGLYMVNRMVEKEGGKIEVESAVNEGTTFKVYFKKVI
ncbi:MAG: sensor histidine kinase [Cytophagaceae bacterium]